MDKEEFMVYIACGNWKAYQRGVNQPFDEEIVARTHDKRIQQRQYEHKPEAQTGLLVCPYVVHQSNSAFFFGLLHLIGNCQPNKGCDCHEEKRKMSLNAQRRF